MTPTDLKRWRGLKDLLRDAVERGASAIEGVHLETARRPFELLERIPPLSQPVRGIQRAHDAVVMVQYAAVRGVTRALGAAVDVGLDLWERELSRADGGSDPR